MPFDWRAISDSQCTQRVDSIKRAWPARKVQLERSASAGAGGTPITVDFGIVPDSEFPAFWPPITPGSVLADLDNRLWILPATSSDAGHGFIYDVVNRQGRTVERVQLPKDYVLRGFGPHHTVYLTKTEGKSTYLARAVFGGPG